MKKVLLLIPALISLLNIQAQVGGNAIGLKLGLNTHSIGYPMLCKELSYHKHTSDLNKFEISLGHMSIKEMEGYWSGSSYVLTSEIREKYSFYTTSLFYHWGIRLGGPKSKLMIGSGIQGYLMRNVSYEDGVKSDFSINQLFAAFGLQLGYERVITSPVPLIFSFETRPLYDVGTSWWGWGVYGTAFRIDFALGVKYAF